MTSDRRRAPRMAPDDRRAAIVAATRPLVLRHGAAVTTRQIAEASGIAEGTIFRVFPDKDAVISAVIADALDQTPSLRELAAVDRALPLRERLVAAVDVLQRRVSEVFGLFGALGWTGGPPDRRNGRPRLPRPVDPDRIENEYRAAVTDLIGPDARLLRLSPAELAHVMRLLVFSGTHPLISAPRSLGPEEIVAILLDGLLAHPATGSNAEPVPIEDHSC
jgi:AcrR family transcriptional regulator